MTILLTTPYEFHVPHTGEVETYGEIQIKHFELETEEWWCKITTRYGDTVDGTWTPGHAPQATFLFRDVEAKLDIATGQGEAGDPIFSTFIGTKKTSAADVMTYAETARALFELLIEQGKYEGVIQ
jgi:hypothetical protein